MIGSRIQSRPPHINVRRGIYLLFILASIVVGFGIPSYYDWTGADQSYSPPVVAQTAWGLILAASLIWLMLPWLPLAGSSTGGTGAARVRFGTRSLLVATAGIALTSGLLLKAPTAVAGTLCALAYCFVGARAIVHRGHRLVVTALLACMVFPFAWAVGEDRLTDNPLTMLRFALALPALLPTAIIGTVVGQNLHALEWLTMLLTAIEMLVGTWMVQLGSKPAVAVLTLVFLLSTIGSFGFHGLMRM